MDHLRQLGSRGHSWDKDIVGRVSAMLEQGRPANDHPVRAAIVFENEDFLQRNLISKRAAISFGCS
jgi:hypothetical protein